MDLQKTLHSSGKQEATEKIGLPLTLRSMIYHGRDPFVDNALTKGVVHCHRVKNEPSRPLSRDIISTTTRKVPTQSSHADNMNLTGCPMEVSFDIDADESCVDSEMEAVGPGCNKKLNMKPLDLLTARQRLNEKSYEKLIGDQALIDWAICDGLDADKTLFVGRECGMSPSNPSRKYVTLHKVNFAGQVTATPDVSYRSHLEALIKEHQSKQVGKVSVSKKANVEYNMASNLSFGDDDGTSSIGGTSRALLTVEWDNPVQLLERPQATYRSARVIGQVVAGDPRSSCHNMFLELKFLENLVRGMAEGGEDVTVTWNDDEAAAVSGLKDLLTFCKDQAHSSAYDVGGEHFPNVEDCGHRTLVDFLDLLWSPLKKVESYSQLCCLWKQIFHTLSQENIRPYIHPQNLTRSAQIVRSVIRDGPDALRGLDFTEASSLPLELLVELGKEKLRRDHIEFFIRSNLMSKLVLDEYIQHSDDNALSLDRLRVLHQLQELCATLQSDTVIEPITLIRPVLEEALKLNGNLKHLQRWPFQVTVRGELVKQLVAKLVPNTWQCELTSESNSVSVRTVGNLCLDSPSPFCPDSTRDESEADEDTDKSATSVQSDNVTYFFTTSFSIKRLV